MKTIKKIFLDDVVSLLKNFFALVIVVGICFLPALYAWFNIYSNWDPYGNTGALQFAAISLDKGFTDDEGHYHNQGDTIIENLHENTAVSWQFVDSSKEAIDGVNSGKYYAAVVVDEDFSYNMYNVLTEEVERPTLHFYENQKKNPVATKISDTVVQTLQNNINVAFTQVVVSTIFSDASEVSDQLQEKGGVENSLEKLRTLSADLTSYQNTINKIIENDNKLKASLEMAKTDARNLKVQAKASADAVSQTAKVSANANTTISSFSGNVNATMDLIGTKIDEIDKELDLAAATENASEIGKYTQNAIIELGKLKILIDSLPEDIGEEALEDYRNEINRLIEAIEESLLGYFIDLTPIKNQLDARYESIKKKLDEKVALNQEEIQYLETEIEKISAIDMDEVTNEEASKLRGSITQSKNEFTEVKNTFKNKLSPKVTRGLSTLTGTLDNTNKLLNSVGETFGNLVIMFNAIDNTVDCANTSLEKTGEAITYVNGRLIEVINQVEQAGSSEKIKVLINALSGDSQMYGKFFSTPVEIKTQVVYPVENYGSAVAPFYSTLAFWVGALILTAIIKIKPDKEKYPDATQRQLFFGRYLLYWVLGQIQALVIVLGDIFLLKIQCLHPWLFMLAASFIATTFTLLIYSLVATWGDAGKALAVVIVVIQIAGSSGTYPIELLPDFFKKVYIFFPFPYAINAIRECICGLYEFDYIKYLGCLMIFMAVALIIGLLIRIPFEPINHYMEERMEDTEVL